MTLYTYLNLAKCPKPENTFSVAANYVTACRRYIS